MLGTMSRMLGTMSRRLFDDALDEIFGGYFVRPSAYETAPGGGSAST